MPTPERAIETEVAILQTQFQNLSERIEEVREEVRSLKVTFSQASDNTLKAVDDLEKANEMAHKTLIAKISHLEKWRWMMMGGGIVLGAAGVPGLKVIFGF